MEDADIRVLLVDDDEMIRDCMTAYLEDEGFTVHCAVSAEEALETIAALCPTVCISDLRLSGMNGEEFISKAFLLCPDTGFLIHTGLQYRLSVELRAIGMTSDDVLLKPMHDLSKLVNKIRLIAAAGRTL
jgi:DNA-binding response OmpR family regulator